jgi:hypothetical protein
MRKGMAWLIKRFELREGGKKASLEPGSTAKKK